MAKRRMLKKKINDIIDIARAKSAKNTASSSWTLTTCGMKS